MDECTQTLLELRTTQLAATLAASGAGAFLLIDPMLGDPVVTEAAPASMTRPALNALRTSAWERPTHALQLPARLDMDAAFAPYLVELQGAQDLWLEASVQWAVQETLQTWTAEPEQVTPHRVGGWLQSAASGQALADVLSGWLQLNAAGAGRASYLRLADRRVLGLAVHVLGQDTVAQALHPVQHWHWLDPRAALRSISTTESTDQPEQPGQPKAPSALVAFSHGQWAHMALGPAVHRLLALAVGAQAMPSDPGGPAQWQPVSVAQWQAALAQAQT